LASVLRYLERNPLRAHLVPRAEHWPRSSLNGANDEWRPMAHEGPIPRGERWCEWVNGIESEAELNAIRHSISRGSPFGMRRWRVSTVRRPGWNPPFAPAAALRRIQQSRMSPPFSARSDEETMRRSKELVNGLSKDAAAPSGWNECSSTLSRDLLARPHAAFQRPTSGCITPASHP
jgi:hypothetical protein